MARAPEATIVLVTFNSADHVLACLQGLAAAADGLSFQVVVADNASRDETVERIEQSFPEHELLRLPGNLGFARAVNLAAARAMAPRVLLLNPDAVMQPGSLRLLVEALDAFPEAAAVGPLLVNSDGSFQVSARRSPSLARLAFDSFMLYLLLPRKLRRTWQPAQSEPHVVECLSGACLLMRRRCFEELGGLDERFFLYGEDVDLCLRAVRAGHELRLVPSARVVHAIGGSAFQDRRSFLVHLHRSQAQLLRKHFRGALGWLGLLIQLAGIGLRVVAFSVSGVMLGRRELLERAGHNAAAGRAVGDWCLAELGIVNRVGDRTVPPAA
jgi:N-acetylglucosaminyl-diphospho-decaprenol L-rhamnosyltransferase